MTEERVVGLGVRSNVREAGLGAGGRWIEAFSLAAKTRGTSAITDSGWAGCIDGGLYLLATATGIDQPGPPATGPRRPPPEPLSERSINSPEALMEGLDGQTAVVTGAGSGIGRASAERLAAEGANVVVADVVSEPGRETVERIEDAGGDATFVEVDVADPASVKAMVDAAVDTYGGLDLAHNNAGILTSFADVTDLDEAEWDRLMAVNLKGVWTCLQAELPVITENGGGAIVNTASESGLVGMPGLSSYSASKHGVVGLTKTVALEYATRNVRVNAIAPGPTETNIAANLEVSEDVESLPFDMTSMSEVPMDRMATPEDMAGVVAFLCSEDASYITGHTVPVDGGQAAD